MREKIAAYVADREWARFIDTIESRAFSTAFAICEVKARSRDSSLIVNGPPRLLSTSVTPIRRPD